MYLFLYIISKVRAQKTYNDVYDIENIDEELLKTANLSLELLSDLKGDNENTIVEAPVNDDFTMEDDQFYSGKYKFSDKDFDDVQSKIENDDVFVEDLKPKKSRLIIKIIIFIMLIILLIVGALLMI